MRRRWLVALAVALAGIGLVVIATRGSDARVVRTHAHAKDNQAAQAVAAALGYLDALRWDVLVDDERRRHVIDRLATPEAAPSLDAALAAPAEALRAVADPPVVARTSPLGYRVERITNRSATVSIWGLALFATASHRASTQWSTSRLRLQLVDERWLVSDVRSFGGPAPDFPLRALAGADRRYRELRHVP